MTYDELKIGMVVQHINGGPLMTVESWKENPVEGGIIDVIPAGVRVVWFDATARLWRDRFDVEMLAEFVQEDFD